ncbi:MAG: multidrug DMT transporter permease [Verrucomicrobia bacterium]|nr:multidrug DMT transporter permease [Verrucomicrobiota bacterium]MBO7391682.1 multidrug DMT transporter permease [Verrucomicrobiota bacterium]MBR4249558.1 multidrug DMT transporter permease [Verrucomicrobiota bacterium]
MFIVNSYFVAVLLCIITMLCWGSWGNTQKLASREWKFQLFYWDYGFGVLIWALLLAFTLGSMGDSGVGRGFIDDIKQWNAGGEIGALFQKNVFWAFVGGVVFNLSNLLLVIAIDIAGLAVAFPVGVGLALVLGVVMTYCLRPEGDPVLLGVGVALVLVAIIINALAYKKLQGSKSGGTPVLGIVISVIAGVLMGCGFFALVSQGMAKNFVTPEAGTMTPYTALVVFSVGLVLSNFIWNSIVMIKPVRGEKVPFSDYFKGSFKTHIIGMLGGIIWNIGMSFSLLAAEKAGAALSYGLGQGATLVAALWGVFIWKEFKGAPKGTNTLLTAMFVFFLAGLGLLIYSKM